MTDIYLIAKECKDFMTSNIQIRRNRVYRGNLIFTDYDVLGKLKEWENLLVQLFDLLKDRYSSIACELKECIDKFGNDPIIYYSSIKTIISCVLSLEEDYKEGKKIFISHSSKDVRHVEDFVNYILCLGIGIRRNDIFCTSIEDLAIKNGGDIRRHIHENIRCAEFSFILISDNYKASEICLNEMGAVWAYDSNVKLFLLPDTNSSSIGWLCDTRKADSISNSVALDRLYSEIRSYFKLPDEFEHWSQMRESFIERECMR